MRKPKSSLPKSSKQFRPNRNWPKYIVPNPFCFTQTLYDYRGGKYKNETVVVPKYTTNHYTQIIEVAILFIFVAFVQGQDLKSLVEYDKLSKNSAFA